MTSTYPMGFPAKKFGWKGTSFNQVIAIIQYNTYNKTKPQVLTPLRLRKALPLKIYRKELSYDNNKSSKTCSRTSMKIADFDRPGNNIVSEVKQLYHTNSLVASLDINPTKISAENGLCTNIAATCGLSPQNNARKRCRSAGMMPRKFNAFRNNDNIYASSTQQYLTSRNMTIKQNEFNYIRKGDSGLTPGPGLAASNIYSPSGLNHCCQPYISAANNNNSFSYVWIDKNTYPITIPDGIYDIASLNQIFQTLMIQNNTYVLDVKLNKYTFMNISYNTRTGSTILYTGIPAAGSSQNTLTLLGYTLPVGGNYGSFTAGTTIINATTTNSNYQYGATYFIVPNNGFAD